MSGKTARVWMVGSVLGLALAAAPAFAQHSGGGGHAGGGGGGGGGHFGGGASHASAAHFGGGSGAHYAPSAHYAPGGGGAHFAGSPAHYGVGGVYGGHPAYGYPGGGFSHGYSTGVYWGGGYWRGGYWPRAYYGLGFSWFLPVLPLAYATYWYDGMPYYYANDVYYTWNPDYSGYTATDPPPVADESGSASADGAAQGSADAPQPAAMPMDAGAAAQIFMYPKNGQSEQQQSVDKRECQQWAMGQAGTQNPGDYRRAMMACVEGRGYSAN